MQNDWQQLFTQAGGTFCIPKEALHTRLIRIKAFVFDWDGVFNDGSKAGPHGSPFSEVDSMGLNLLRFCCYTQTKQLPLVVLLSGERSENMIALALRERFQVIYCKARHKPTALEHMQSRYSLQDNEVAFVFDDVADLPVAARCGLRMAIRRPGSPLFDQYIRQNALADYITGQRGGCNAVREVCEVLMGGYEKYEETVELRARFAPLYQEYLAHRATTQPIIYDVSSEGFSVAS